VYFGLPILQLNVVFRWRPGHRGSWTWGERKTELGNGMDELGWSITGEGKGGIEKKQGRSRYPPA